MKAFILIVFALLAIAYAQYPSTVYGVDVSTYVTQTGFSCLVSKNLTFTIVRGYESVGQVDSNVVPTVANAWAGGMSHVDVYMFPCPTCSESATNQFQDLYNYLRQNGVQYGQIWLDIEGPQYWSSSISYNQNFFSELVAAGQNNGVNLGVYSSRSQWEPIFGGGFTAGSSLPLWYADYDGVPDFDDFSSFGGWSSPAMKQFSDAGAKCGVSYDINWYPAK
eukprot:TRINITY_DN10467_c0_g1_i1.p1 TRINITY_DN10467_c0_g1~~TRINITY_DN10467_c0_g1_i1.p1  ORF type:complete len:232 (+),score=52.02 TRINITY_DN10467_c0_g1_i1:36-698(+)